MLVLSQFIRRLIPWKLKRVFSVLGIDLLYRILLSLRMKGRWYYVQNIGYFLPVGYFSDVILDEIKSGNQFSRDILDLLLLHYRKGDIVDCGANFGCFSLPLSQLMQSYYPNTRIHAIECNPFVFSYLSKSAENYTNLHLYNCAISDRDGYYVVMDSFDSHRSSTFGSLSITSWFDADTGQPSSNSPRILTSRLDTLIDLDREIGLIKLDIQGFELFALKGAASLIKKWKPTILIEIDTYFLGKNSVLPNQIFNYLDTFGYAAINSSLEDFKQPGSRDVVFVHESLIIK